ncbi:CHAD domain-containing protein [Altericroceibacterium spongiae]|uniref:CHAD domain-containing protein n=1 Tax=Altericroceibacterium spongiae TaxID=2320269 RepID=A0A420ER04_9SPHN|nr:CHAD domain-containing protein [Altericroceibacterium spongiae]RKF23126.1 CHAD domain-containing protein [Altericroceibacterium spongiae]
MAYRFRRKDKTVETGIRRIAREQIDKAIASIDSEDDDAEIIHAIRKRCKKLRALLRLVGPSFPKFQKENRIFADTSDLVGDLRHPDLMERTYRQLVKTYNKELNCKSFLLIGENIKAQREADLSRMDIDARLAACRNRFREASKRVAYWHLEEEGWEALSAGVLGVYERACAALDATKSDNGNAYYELRKWMKYHRHHMRILRPIAPTVFAERAKHARKLTKLLAGHNNLLLFEDRLRSEPATYGADEDIEAILILARRQRIVQDAEISRAAHKLLQYEPDDLSRKWGKMWAEWADKSQ